ncbi:hypothetical protein BaRGS_00016410 [Batillaria attramentaria]|uniref:Uncharacterized protein n=1 Tax=Batillaria attramentaria TaxID=370345 RepID=A0ABD0KYR0_9CAEN
MTDSSEPDCSVSDKDDQEFVPGTESESDSDTEVQYPRLEELQGIVEFSQKQKDNDTPKDNGTPSESDTKDKQVKGMSFKGKPGAKKHYCVFCGNAQSRLQRHLESKHSEEKGMVQFLNSTGKTKKDELAKLRHAGDHQHNIQVFKRGEGEIVVKRGKRDSSPPQENFLPCPKCLGYFQKKDMYRHDCVACPKEDCGPRRQLVKKGKLLMPGVYEKDSEALQLFWNSLTNDNVAVVAKNDSLIGIFGTSAIKTKRKGFDKDNFAQIRNSVRELSRLLIELRSMTKTAQCWFE